MKWFQRVGGYFWRDWEKKEKSGRRVHKYMDVYAWWRDTLECRRSDDDDINNLRRN